MQQVKKSKHFCHYNTLCLSIADSDYQSINQTVEFLPTERANEVVIVNSIDDSIIEGTEFAGIRIVIPPQFQETVRIGSVGQRLIEIDDDDGNLL